jgi:hypothetical protein
MIASLPLAEIAILEKPENRRKPLWRLGSRSQTLARLWQNRAGVRFDVNPVNYANELANCSRETVADIVKEILAERGAKYGN